MKVVFRILVLAAVGVASQAALANDQLDYERRVGSRLAGLFVGLDRNADGQVSREEARGDLNFVPLFDDMDINRDGLVTRDELRRYLEFRFGSHAAEAGGRALPAAAASQVPTPAR